MQEHLKDFFASIDRLEYSQPIVADTIGASLADLNQYRKRGLILESGWEYAGRVSYTGRALLFAGVVNELAWSIGPKRASEIMTDYQGHISGIAAGTAGDWRDDVLMISGRGVRHGPCASLVKRSSLEDDFRLHHAALFLPFGRLIEQWGTGAELRRKDG